MSHELRTPLNAIIGFSELLQSEVAGSLGSDQNREYIGDIHNSGEHLLQVINDILDISKIEAGEMELHESVIDVRDVVASCLTLVGERAENAAITLDTDMSANLQWLRADECKLKQILLNLLSNAVKFTPDNGNVTVRCEIEPNGAFTLCVADTGIGIAAQDIDKVLEKFGQVDSTLQRQYDGTGLGLPLVKSMVELHDGSFALESELGAGTRAIVRLPPERVIASDNVTRLNTAKIRGAA